MSKTFGTALTAIAAFFYPSPLCLEARRKRSVLAISADDFTGTRLRDSRRILAAFYADWCPFCRSFLAVFRAAMKQKTELLGALVDISDTNSPLWGIFEVNIVPTLVGFRDGKAFFRKDGLAGIGLGKPELEDAILKMKEA